jgi:hypothetical protein
MFGKNIFYNILWIVLFIIMFWGGFRMLSRSQYQMPPQKPTNTIEKDDKNTNEK